MEQYQILFKAGNGMIGCHFIQSEIDLIEIYKKYLLMGESRIIVWEKGILDASQVLGIFKNI